MSRSPRKPTHNKHRAPRRPAAPPETPRLIAFNKPARVLTQFTDAANRVTLADYIDIPDIYPAGRLDRDSEGLLLLTNDGRLQSRITDPRHALPKTYWAQVEGEPTPAQLAALSAGPVIKDGATRPAAVEVMRAPDIWPRRPPIRHRPTVPTTWLEMTIREGRNRQVRRMTAAVGLPTLRLVRIRIGAWGLDGLASGRWRVRDLPSGFGH